MSHRVLSLHFLSRVMESSLLSGDQNDKGEHHGWISRRKYSIAESCLPDLQLSNQSFCV